MSMPVRTLIIGLAGMMSWPAGGQLLGPSWETVIVLTRQDLDVMQTTLDQQVYGKAVGTVASWRNPTSGHAGSFRLRREFTRAGQRCEQILYTIEAENREVGPEHYLFNVCLQSDGTWKFA
jgi:hypothetical protein